MKMSCSMTLVAVCILMYHTTVADDLLIRIGKFSDLYEGAPKLWHQYVKEYLFVVQSQMKSCSFLVKYFSVILKSTEQFLNHSQSKVQNPEINSNVKLVKVSGQIKLVGQVNMYSQQATFIWAFQVDNQLALNFTFKSLNFSSHPEACDDGSLKMNDASSGKDKFIYCGQHSPFNLYPLSHRLTVNISMIEFIHYQIDIFYYIIDNNIIRNVPVEHDGTMYKVSSVLHLKQSKTIHSFHIEVEKNMYLTLFLPLKYIENATVFDGPGIYSNVLKPMKDIYETSTFQCVLILTLKNNEMLDLNILFDSKWFDISETLFVADSDVLEVSVPNIHCHASPCALLVKSEHKDKQVNVSIIKMEYNGFVTADCNYGGVVAMEPLGNSYRDITSFCESHDQLHGHSQRVYSKNSTLLLVLYWYEYYSNISRVEFRITVTKCKPVRIHTCELTNNCVHYCHYLYNFCSARRLRAMCANYFQSRLQHTRFKLEKTLSYFHTYLFSMPENECAIVQLLSLHKYHYQTYSINPTTKCDFILESSFTDSIDMMINYEIRASFSAAEAAHHNEDEVEFKGLPEEVCCSSRNGILQKTATTLTCRQDIQLGTWSSKENYTNFYAVVTDKTPTNINSFNIWTRRLRWSRSWIEIVISLHKIDQPEGTNIPILEIYTTRKFRHHPQQMLLLVMSPKNGTKWRKGQIVEMTVKIYSDLSSTLNCDPTRLQNYDFQTLLSMDTDRLKNLTGDILKLSEDQTPKTLNWNSVIRFSELKRHQYISIPGVSTVVSYMFRSPSNISRRYLLKAQWIENKYKTYEEFLQNRAKCCDPEVVKKINYSLCRKFSDLSSQNGNKERVHYILLRSLEKLSWLNAEESCRELDGYLPSFSSRDQLQKFLAFAKLSRDLPPLNAVYIGLKYVQTGKRGADFKWTSNAPVSFQVFHNRYFTMRLDKDMWSYVYGEQMFASDGKLPNVASGKIFPILEKSYACSLMLLTNLAEPDWISISCNDKILSDVMCSVQLSTRKSLSNLPTFFPQDKFCKSSQLYTKGKCLYLFWINSTNISSRFNICENLGMVEQVFKNISELNWLLKATSGRIAPVIFLSSNNKLYKYLHNTAYLPHQVEIYSDTVYHGYYICAQHRERKSNDLTMFLCSDGLYISAASVCDEKIDCLDGSDEGHCICNEFDDNHLNECRYTKAQDKIVCSLLFHTTVDGTCVRYVPNITNSRLMEPNNITHMCSSGLKIAMSLVDDLIVDCGTLYDDEGLLVTLMKSEKTYSCNNENQLPCKPGHPRCYNISSICTYRLSSYNHLIPCRNGGHLESCKDFECNMMFKCPESYCIPWSYVCDGKWDCFKGTDELQTVACNDRYRCKNMFQCKSTHNICIHIASICDGIMDCPLQDDEHLCELENIKCPETCYCATLALLCINTSVALTQYISPFIAMKMYFSQLQAIPYDKLENAVHLTLAYSNLSEICTDQAICSDQEINKLMSLNVEFNSVKIISRNCFCGMTILKKIALYGNHINFIESQAFSGLAVLSILNLSNNKIIDFPKRFLWDSKALQVLSIKQNPLTDIQVQAFTYVSAQVIEASGFHICCILPSESKCTADISWYISCSDLLPTLSLKLTFVLISILIMSANVCSMIFNVLTRKENMAYCVTAVSVNMNDIIFAIYLLIIWIANYSFQDEFSVREEKWRSSFACFTAFNFAFTYNIMTPIILLFLSLSRLMVVLYPVDTKFKKTRYVSKTIAACYSCVFAVSIISTLMIKYSYVILPTSLCLPFIDPTNSWIIVKVITWLVAIFQLSISVVIIVAHYLLVSRLRESQRNIRKSKVDDHSNTMLIAQLVIVTGSNIICWLPTNIIYITSMFFSQYPSVMVIWTAVAVAPINSIINPIVFSLTCLRKMCKETKKPKSATAVGT